MNCDMRRELARLRSDIRASVTKGTAYSSFAIEEDAFSMR